MLHLLECYEKTSGQLLNKDKTCIFFSKNTPNEVKENITQITGVWATSSLDKYLGLPTIIGRSKLKAFWSLLDKTWQRIFNWKYKFLSMVKKEIMLKVALQAILTYTMSIFLLPKNVTSWLNSILKKFWWGSNGENAKIF